MKLLKLILKKESFDPFMNWLKLVKSILKDDANLFFKKEGIHIRSLDPPRVAMVDTLFDKTFFSEYSYDERFVGIDTERLLKIMKAIKPNKKTDVQFSFEIAEKRITVIGHFADGRIRKLGLVPLDLGESQLPVPDKEFKVEYIIDTEFFIESIKTAEMFFSDIHIKADDVSMLKLRNKPSKDISVDLFEEDIPAIAGTIQEEAIGLYNTNYLIDHKPTLKFNKKMLVEFSASMPIKLSWAFGEQSYYHFYLAPRIET